MAIDSDITIANLVTQSLKNAGRVAPSAAQITDATAYQFRRVKSDIALKSGQHPALLAQYVTTLNRGQQRYAWPTDAHMIRSVTFLDGPDEWWGLAQAGASTSVTLGSLVDQDADDLEGLFVVITAGTGANQIRQITDWDNSTKIATVDTAWTTNPTSGSTYLVVTSQTKLWQLDKPTEWHTHNAIGSRGKSYSGAMSGREFWLTYAPDKQYALWWDYWAHMDLLDNDSAVLLKHIRMYYTLWSQGLTAWLCQRYDEDRYASELTIYQNLLDAYGAEASQVRVMQPYDV